MNRKAWSVQVSPLQAVLPAWWSREDVDEAEQSKTLSVSRSPVLFWVASGPRCLSHPLPHQGHSEGRRQQWMQPLHNYLPRR